MKQMTTFAVTTALTSLVAFNSYALKPATHGTGIVQEINVGDVGNQPVVIVRNMAVNKQLASINLQPQSNSLQMKLKGDVKCGGAYINNVIEKIGYTFMSARIGVGPEQEAYWDVPAGASNDLNKANHSVIKTLNVPIAEFNGTAHEIDVSEFVMQKAAQHAQNGGNKVDYLRKDHNYYVQVPIRFQADCRKYTRKKISKKTIIEAGETNIVASKMINVRIAYKGDKNLTGTALLAANNSQAQVGGYNGGPNQSQGKFQAQEQKPSISSGKFLVAPHKLKGKCALDAEFTVEVKGAGEGHVRIRIDDTGKQVHQSPSLAFNNGKAVYSFKTTVGTGSQGLLNATFSHPYQIKVRTKGKNDPTFPNNWTPIAGASVIWQHTCTNPVTVNPAIGGTGKKLYAPNKPTPPRPPRAKTN